MATAQRKLTDWDAVYYAIRTELAKATADAGRYKLLAEASEVSLDEYVAAKLTRSIQASIDTTSNRTLIGEAFICIFVRLIRTY
jgi:hypothetical protein